MSERDELHWLCTEASLPAELADQLISEKITMALLLSSTLPERREILRAMGLRYGTILIINRALELRLRLQERAEIEEEAGRAADDDDSCGGEDEGESVDELEVHAARRVVSDVIASVVAESSVANASDEIGEELRSRLLAATMLLQRAEAGTLRGLQVYLGNVLVEPAQAGFRTIQLANPLFQERVWGAPGGASIIRAAGFTEAAKQTLLFPSDAPLAPLLAAKRIVDRLLLQAEPPEIREDELSPMSSAQESIPSVSPSHLPISKPPDGVATTTTQADRDATDIMVEAEGHSIIAVPPHQNGEHLLPQTANAPSAIGYMNVLADMKSRKAIEMLIEDAHTQSWDTAMSSGYTVRYDSLSVHEIRCCRACNQGRLAALLGRLIRSLWSLSCSSCEQVESSPTRLRYLNHLKILTRLMPVMFEDAEDVGVHHLLWSSLAASPLPEAAAAVGRDDQATAEQLHCLGGSLLHAILRAFFVKGFTVLAADDEAPANPWSFSSAAADEARNHVMQALISCCSASLYVPAATLSSLPNRMLRAATSASEPLLKALFRALLSVTFSYDPVGWGVPYSHSLVSDSHAEVMHTSSQLLLVLLSQGEGSQPFSDKMSRLLAGLQRKESLGFLVDGFGRLLRNSHESQTTYLPSSRVQLECEQWPGLSEGTIGPSSQELVLLLWKFMHGNRAFLVALLQAGALQHVVLSLCHLIFAWVDDVARPSLVHLCMLCLLLLSTEKELHALINKRCPATLPSRGRLEDPCSGSIADLLVSCVANVILTDHQRLECVYPAALAVLANLSPHVTHFSYSSSHLMLRMLAALSAPSFLLASSNRPEHLITLVDVFSSALLHQSNTNVPLLSLLLLNAPMIEALPHMQLPEGQSQTGEFVPTSAWMEAWKTRLNLRPIQLLLQVLLPKVDSENPQLDNINEQLTSTSLAGVFPPAPPISVRCYQPDDNSHAWLTQVIWGIVYSRNQGLFDARSVKLVQIMQID